MVSCRVGIAATNILSSTIWQHYLENTKYHSLWFADQNTKYHVRVLEWKHNLFEF